LLESALLDRVRDLDAHCLKEVSAVMGRMPTGQRTIRDRDLGGRG
jgi:hypothetical protein